MAFIVLADEEAEQLVLAAAVFGELVGIGGEDFVDHRLDRAAVALLLEALGLSKSRPVRAQS